MRTGVAMLCAALAICLVSAAHAIDYKLGKNIVDIKPVYQTEHHGAGAVIWFFMGVTSPHGKTPGLVDVMPECKEYIDGANRWIFSQAHPGPKWPRLSNKGKKPRFILGGVNAAIANRYGF